MAFRLFAKQEKTWVVHLQPVGDSIIVQIRTPPLWKDYRSVYIDLLDRILQDYEILALSQLIDERQWGEEIPDRQKYANAISQRFLVQGTITTAYDKVAPPEPTSDSFIIHLVGHPNRTLLEELLEFGMGCLPHIMYGLRGTPTSWPLEVLSWNGIFINWFHLKETDTALVKLAQQSGLLLWTADRNLSLALPEASGMDRILAHVEAVAQRWNLRMMVDQTGLAN
jgi:hypothetical protein